MSLDEPGAGLAALRPARSFRRGPSLLGDVEEEAARSEAGRLEERPPRPRRVQPDLSQLGTYVYPVDFPLREYQFAMVQSAIKANTLVALPTGLGKTFIAACVMYNFWRWFPGGKVLFVAPTKPLVAQQMRACHQIMGIPESDGAELTGETANERRGLVWEQKRVLFLTPQTLQNDLESGACPAELVVLVVVDEAHRATGDHASAAVVREVLGRNAWVRVLALTATPGADPAAVQALVDALRIERVEARSEEDPDVAPHVHGRRPEVIRVRPLREAVAAAALLRSLLWRPLSLLHRAGAVSKDKTAEKIGALALRAAQGQYSVGAGQAAPPSESRKVQGAFGCALELLEIVEAVEQRGARAGLAAAEGFQRAALDRALAHRYDVIADEGFERLLSLLQQAGAQGAGHPKVDALAGLLRDHFGEEGAEGTRAMVFASQRDAVELLHRSLAEVPGVRALPFIGQGSSSRKGAGRGLTQAEQQETLEKFRRGECNVLLCTSVGEEGLDIGEVDLIVCYDALASPTRTIQRMGRTGRKREGRVVVLEAAGDHGNFARSAVASAGAARFLREDAAGRLRFYRSPVAVIPPEADPQPFFRRGGAQPPPGPVPAAGSNPEKPPIADGNPFAARPAAAGKEKENVPPAGAQPQPPAAPSAPRVSRGAPPPLCPALAPAPAPWPPRSAASASAPKTASAPDPATPTATAAPAGASQPQPPAVLRAPWASSSRGAPPLRPASAPGPAPWPFVSRPATAEGRGPDAGKPAAASSAPKPVPAPWAARAPAVGPSPSSSAPKPDPGPAHPRAASSAPKPVPAPWVARASSAGPVLSFSAPKAASASSSPKPAPAPLAPTLSAPWAPRASSAGPAAPAPAPAPPRDASASWPLGKAASCASAPGKAPFAPWVRPAPPAPAPPVLPRAASAPAVPPGRVPQFWPVRNSSSSAAPAPAPTSPPTVSKYFPVKKEPASEAPRSRRRPPRGGDEPENPEDVFYPSAPPPPQPAPASSPPRPSLEVLPTGEPPAGPSVLPSRPSLEILSAPLAPAPPAQDTAAAGPPSPARPSLEILSGPPAPAPLEAPLPPLPPSVDLLSPPPARNEPAAEWSTGPRAGKRRRAARLPRYSDLEPVPEPAAGPATPDSEPRVRRRLRRGAAPASPKPASPQQAEPEWKEKRPAGERRSRRLRGAPTAAERARAAVARARARPRLQPRLNAEDLLELEAEVEEDGAGCSPDEGGSGSGSESGGSLGGFLVHDGPVEREPWTDDELEGGGGGGDSEEEEDGDPTAMYLESLMSQPGPEEGPGPPGRSRAPRFASPPRPRAVMGRHAFRIRAPLDDDPDDVIPSSSEDEEDDGENPGAGAPEAEERRGGLPADWEREERAEARQWRRRTERREARRRGGAGPRPPPPAPPPPPPPPPPPIPLPPTVSPYFAAPAQPPPQEDDDDEEAFWRAVAEHADALGGPPQDRA